MVGQVGEADAVGLVGHAHLDGLEGVEDVELGERHLGQRVEAHGLAQHDGVEPPTAPLAPGVGAELVAPLDEELADVVLLLGRERPGADPGDVGLGDADHPLDVPWPEPRAGAGAAGHRVGGGDEGVGPVVEVEEGGLGALEQHLAALVHGVVDHAHRVAHHGLDTRRVLAQVARRDVAGVQREAVVDLGQDGVLLLEGHVELLAEDLGVEEVLDPDADAGRLVGVRGADAALGRPQRVLAEEALGHPVELLVVRHDQVRIATHDEAAGVDALGGQAVELLEQHGGVDDDAVADDRRDVVVEDAARHELQCEGLAVDDDAVAGVVATLVAHDHVHLAGEEVGELALPLVAPLGPDHNGCGHASLRSLKSPRITHQCTAPRNGGPELRSFRPPRSRGIGRVMDEVGPGGTPGRAGAERAGRASPGRELSSNDERAAGCAGRLRGGQRGDRGVRAAGALAGRGRRRGHGGGGGAPVRHGRDDATPRPSRPLPGGPGDGAGPGRGLRRRRPAGGCRQPGPAPPRRRGRRLPDGPDRGGQADRRHLPRAVDPD